MNIILTSNPAFSFKKENGTRKAIKLENIELVEQIKKNVTRYKDLFDFYYLISNNKIG